MPASRVRSSHKNRGRLFPNSYPFDVGPRRGDSSRDRREIDKAPALCLGEKTCKCEMERKDSPGRFSHRVGVNPSPELTEVELVSD